ncbi:hypothetical protein H6758_04085 [Candidatus Nomurabacteria bacterium]|nr:hypothetical protein [Candidatus Nomurabacteria bacterium]
MLIYLVPTYVPKGQEVVMGWHKNPALWGVALGLLAVQVLLAALGWWKALWCLDTSLIVGVTVWNFREFFRKFAFNDQFDGQLPLVIQSIPGLPRRQVRMRSVVIRRVNGTGPFAIKLGMRLMDGLDWYGAVNSGDKSGGHTNTLVFETFVGSRNWGMVVMYRSRPNTASIQVEGLGEVTMRNGVSILDPRDFTIEVTDQPPFAPTQTFAPHLIQRILARLGWM